MSEALFGLVATYGIAAVFLSAYFSCLGVPVPTAFVMLAGGAFATSGDLDVSLVLAAALAGAVLGDQTGFHIGRLGGSAVTGRLERQPGRRAVLARARRAVDRWGGIGVFFSTWLVSPLGPYVNLVAGVSRMGWGRFTAWDTAGETIWVCVYVGLGYAFSSHIGLLADMLGNWIAFLTAAVVTALLGLPLVGRVRRGRAKREQRAA